MGWGIFVKQLVFLLILCSFLSAQKFLIISNKNLNLQNISARKLKAIFSGEQDKLNSRTVKLVYYNAKNSDSFYKKVFGKAVSKVDIAKMWKAKKRRPKIFNNAKDLYLYVLSTRDAIAFIDKQEMAKFNANAVNILTINGVNSNHAKYYLSSK